jgi:hypothetical protein
VITTDWRHTGQNAWDEDERARRGLYRDGEAIYSHSSYPLTDDLSFYLSYHAMFTVAARLLAKVPTHKDPMIVMMGSVRG